MRIEKIYNELKKGNREKQTQRFIKFIVEDEFIQKLLISTLSLTK